MNSTSTSNSEILRVENLSLAYNISLYKSYSLRDSFVQVVSHPIDSLLKNRNSLTALKDINFKLEKGDRLGILGVNGSGKTTLCRCLAGMLFPQVGKIHLNGEVRSIFNTAIGILPALTGRENARLLADLLYPKESEETLNRVIKDALEFSELDNFLDAPFHTYSRGMQTRLCLSVISALPTDLLILDEVFDGADEFFQRKIARRVLEMIEKSGAVIFVSHNAEQVRMSCNKVMVLNNSEIKFFGELEKGIAFYKTFSN